MTKIEELEERIDILEATTEQQMGYIEDLVAIIMGHVCGNDDTDEYSDVDLLDDECDGDCENCIFAEDEDEDDFDTDALIDGLIADNQKLLDVIAELTAENEKLRSLNPAAFKRIR